jgi:hypothetical protein
MIAGAGPGGAPLHTHVASMTDPTHITVDIAAIATPVTNASVSFDQTVEQYNFFFKGGGPYVVTGSYMGSPMPETAFTAPIGTLFLSGVGFHEAFVYSNPLNTSGPIPAGLTWTGLWHGDNPTNRMPDHFNTTSPPTVYFHSNAGFGANNNWVVNSAEPSTPGMRLIVVVDTLTLQAGPNRITYNGITGNVLNTSNSNFLDAPLKLESLGEFILDSKGNWRLVGR